MENFVWKIDSELLEQLRALLAPNGMEPEELAVTFIHWCVKNPELAKESLMKWKEELCQEELTKEKEGGV